MPPLPPISGIARAVLQYNLLGELAVNVMHFSQPGGGSPFDVANLAEALESWWRAQVRPTQSSSCTLEKIITTDLGVAGGPSHELTVPAPAAGLVTGAAMPNSIAVCVSIKTALRGRSYRGRIYHMGVPDAHVTDNLLGTAQATALTTAYSAIVLLATAGNPDYRLGVLSYYSQGQQRGTPIFTPSTEVSIDTRVDSQRRRMPRV